MQQNHNESPLLIATLHAKSEKDCQTYLQQVLDAQKIYREESGRDIHLKAFVYTSHIFESYGNMLGQWVLQIVGYSNYIYWFHKSLLRFGIRCNERIEGSTTVRFVNYEPVVLQLTLKPDRPLCKYKDDDCTFLQIW